MTSTYTPDEISDIEARILEKIEDLGGCDNIHTTRLRYYQAP